MAEVFRDIAGLRGFLLESHEAHAAGEMEPVDLPNGFTQETYESGSLKLVDRYVSTQDETEFSGEYVVFVGGQPVWHDDYHALIKDPDALTFYLDKVVANPDPDMPIVGESALEDNKLVYGWAPKLSEVPTLSRFVLEEVMWTKREDDGIDEYNPVFEGIQRGGWL